MPKNRASFTRDGTDLRITFTYFFVKIPASETATLCDGRPLPNFINLDEYPRGFSIAGADGNSIFSYGPMRSKSPGDRKSSPDTTRKAENRVIKARSDAFNGAVHKEPRRAASDQGLFLPEVVAARCLSLTRSEGAVSPEGAKPAAPPFRRARIQEVLRRNSIKKVMYAGDRYGWKSSAPTNKSENGSIAGSKITSSTQGQGQFRTTNGRLVTRQRSASTPVAHDVSKAPSLSSFGSSPYRTQTRRKARTDPATSVTPGPLILHSQWNIPGRRTQLITSHEGAAQSHQEAENPDGSAVNGQVNDGIIEVPTLRGRTLPSERQNTKHEAERKERAKRRYTGMAYYDKSTGWVKPKIESRRPRTHALTRGVQNPRQHLTIRKFSSQSNILHCCGGDTVKRGIDFSRTENATRRPLENCSSPSSSSRMTPKSTASPTTSSPNRSQTHASRSMIPTPRLSSVKTNKENQPLSKITTTRTQSAPPLSTMQDPRQQTHKYLPPPVSTGLHCSTTHALSTSFRQTQSSKRPLQISPLLPINLAASPLSTTPRLPMSKRKKSNSAFNVSQASGVGGQMDNGMVNNKSKINSGGVAVESEMEIRGPRK
ncbi:MAG: hypothetical protein Q9171_001802 [Xanthocarpia ochracea]